MKKDKENQISGFIMAYTMTPANGEMYGLPKNKIKDILDKIGQERKFGKKYKVYKDFIDSTTGNAPSNPMTKYENIKDQINNIGIFSLSERIDSGLMWGHYADGARGIAIGFSVDPNTMLSNENHCLKVMYSNDDNVLNERLETSLLLGLENDSFKFYQKISWNDPFFKSVISSKAEDWRYECEWRYVEETSGLYELPAPIKEIVFGSKCPDEIRKEYIKLVKEHIGEHVEFYEMKTEGKQFVKVRFQ
ncbi:DUF2971 domain-containing protein [Alkaliphilus metalliredigens]|uniref:DUF2971 domain-containing protein n=1 Tax=Alkaliphilus metalliredigens TaxID=208226 RepID=UPI0018DE45BA|nr:DUF2971 domain-containing protein [Alkaliphilus metalliredigens]